MTDEPNKGGRPSLYTPAIYGLYGTDGSLRYIGKANVPEYRLKTHMRDARRRNTPLYAWIRKHGEPSMRVLEADCADWKEAERRLIAEARARGDRLLNVADGGDQPCCPRSTRIANARRLHAKIGENELFARVWRAKRALAGALRSGELSDYARECMRRAAASAPKLFGSWANVPSRKDDTRCHG